MADAGVLSESTVIQLPERAGTVECQFKGKGKFYPGKVEAVNVDGTFAIRLVLEAPAPAPGGAWSEAPVCAPPPEGDAEGFVEVPVPAPNDLDATVTPLG